MHHSRTGRGTGRNLEDRLLALLDGAWRRCRCGAKRYGASSSSLRRLHRLWSSNASRRFSILVGWGYLFYLTLPHLGKLGVVCFCSCPSPPYPIEIRISALAKNQPREGNRKKKKSRCLSTGSQRETESCVSSTTDSGALERRGMTLLFRTFLISCVGQRTVARMSGQIPPNSVSVKVHTQIGPGTGHWRRN